MHIGDGDATKQAMMVGRSGEAVEFVEEFRSEVRALFDCSPKDSAALRLIDRMLVAQIKERRAFRDLCEMRRAAIGMLAAFGLDHKHSDDETVTKALAGQSKFILCCRCGNPLNDGGHSWPEGWVCLSCAPSGSLPPGCATLADCPQPPADQLEQSDGDDGVKSCPCACGERFLVDGAPADGHRVFDPCLRPDADDPAPGFDQTTGAQQWVRAFVWRASNDPEFVNEANMIGWFANAIESGRAEGMRAEIESHAASCKAAIEGDEP